MQIAAAGLKGCDAHAPQSCRPCPLTCQCAGGLALHSRAPTACSTPRQRMPCRRHCASLNKQPGALQPHRRREWRSPLAWLAGGALLAERPEILNRLLGRARGQKGRTCVPIPSDGDRRGLLPPPSTAHQAPGGMRKHQYRSHLARKCACWATSGHGEPLRSPGLTLTLVDGSQCVTYSGSGVDPTTVLREKNPV